MVRRICLDSDVIISLLNKDEKTKEIISKLDAQFHTTAINSFEIWYGRKTSEKIVELMASLNVIVFDKRTSLFAGDILRELKKKGKMIELKDLFIAATCIKNNIELLTYNKKHFQRLKEFGLAMI